MSHIAKNFKNATAHLHNLMKPGNFAEFVFFNSILFVVVLFVGGVIDKTLNAFFKLVEQVDRVHQVKQFQCKDKKWWILFKILVQLLVVILITYFFHIFALDAVLSNTHLHDGINISSVVYASYGYLIYFQQKHLQKNLHKIKL